MIIAHRGIHNNKDVPENSILSYKLAMDKNYGIELDIHISKDNQLVVLHDDNLKRMTNTDKLIENLTLDEIKHLHLLKTSERIPTFSEVLNLVNGKVLLDIEIKNTKKIKPVCDLILKELKKYKGEILLKSFNPLIVKELKRKCHYKVGILITKKSNNVLLDFFVKTKLIYLFKFDFIAINKQMLNKKYYNEYSKKYPIYVWTFKDLEEANKHIKRYQKIIPICNGL